MGIAFFPKQNEKKRFAAILITFAIVFIGAVVFGFYCLFLYLQKPSPVIPTTAKQEEKVSAEIRQFGIKIDKIDVLAPVIKDVDGTNKATYNKELEKGVAHYKGTALPDQGSNIFVFGHSSPTIGTGPYVEIFARLDELEADDKITIYYENQEYEYYVFEKRAIEKTETSVLLPTEKEQLTLMTCWPIGSNARRLIIKAEPKGENPAQIGLSY